MNLVTSIIKTPDDLLARALRRIVGEAHVHTDLATRASFGFDAYFQRAVPSLIVAPASAEDLASVVRLLAAEALPFLVRGRGTGYAGGSVPVNGEIVVLTTRLNRIREINVEERWLVAEAGAITGDVQAAARAAGLRYPADPSSYAISTIGGNVATNAGGPHCLGYGVTSNYVLELECVSAMGEMFTLGNATGLATGLDLRGVVVGSEGTTAIVTAVKLRLVPQPQAVRTVYARFDDARQGFPALCGIFEQGLLPIALDMTANVIDPTGAPLPFPNDSLLYIEIDGDVVSTETRTRQLCDVLAAHPCDVTVQDKSDLMEKRFRITQERWRGITQILKRPAYFLFDAVVRRSDLAEMFEVIVEQAQRFDFVVANTFHAGDGNIHPTPFFDPRIPGIHERLEEFRDSVLSHVARLEGALSGEHGIGLEKRHLIPAFFSQPAQRLQLGVLGAFQTERKMGGGKLLPDTIGEHAPPPRRTLRTLGLHPADGYALFDAKTSLADVRLALADSRYQFAYEPVGLPAETSLGAALIAGRPGLREGRFGWARDLLLGGMLEGASGACFEFGSVYAKDVSGIDIRKLVFGSQGRIGRLRTAAIKLLPCDEMALLARLPVADVGEAQLRLRDLKAMEGPLGSFHLVHEQGSYTLAFLIEGFAAGVEPAAEALVRRFDAAGLVIEPWTGVALAPRLAAGELLAWHPAPLRDAPGITRGGSFVALAYPALVGVVATSDPSTVEDDLPAAARFILEIADDL